MKNYNIQYKKYEKGSKKISPLEIERGNFYILKEYVDVDGVKHRYASSESPIIFVIFTSLSKDEVHAIKITNIVPQKIKRLFEKLLNKDTKEIELVGSSKKIYEQFLKKVPAVTNEAYRTYKWGGIKNILLLQLEEEAVVSKQKLKINKK